MIQAEGMMVWTRQLRTAGKDVMSVAITFPHVTAFGFGVWSEIIAILLDAMGLGRQMGVVLEGSKIVFFASTGCAFD